MYIDTYDFIVTYLSIIMKTMKKNNAEDEYEKRLYSVLKISKPFGARGNGSGYNGPAILPTVGPTFLNRERESARRIRYLVKEILHWTTVGRYFLIIIRELKGKIHIVVHEKAVSVMTIMPYLKISLHRGSTHRSNNKQSEQTCYKIFSLVSWKVTINQKVCRMASLKYLRTMCCDKCQY